VVVVNMQEQVYLEPLVVVAVVTAAAELKEQVVVAIHHQHLLLKETTVVLAILNLLELFILAAVVAVQGVWDLQQQLKLVAALVDLVLHLQLQMCQMHLLVVVAVLVHLDLVLYLHLVVLLAQAVVVKVVGLFPLRLMDLMEFKELAVAVAVVDTLQALHLHMVTVVLVDQA